MKESRHRHAQISPQLSEQFLRRSTAPVCILLRAPPSIARVSPHARQVPQVHPQAVLASQKASLPKVACRVTLEIAGTSILIQETAEVSILQRPCQFALRRHLQDRYLHRPVRISEVSVQRQTFRPTHMVIISSTEPGAHLSRMYDRQTFENKPARKARVPGDSQSPDCPPTTYPYYLYPFGNSIISCTKHMRSDS